MELVAISNAISSLRLTVEKISIYDLISALLSKLNSGERTSRKLKWHTTTTTKAVATFKEKCTPAVGTAQNAVKKSPNCHSSRIRPDWTSCFAGTATEIEGNLSEEITAKSKTPVRGFLIGHRQMLVK